MINIFKPRVDLFCPKCGSEQTCPCQHCREQNKRRSQWEWTKDGNHCRCAKCGFTAHVDWWESWSYGCHENPFRMLVKRIRAIIKTHYK
jgi:predicted RNA-binding Zn-ribbon protein involved in translation (DUF1610 family)